MKVPTDKLDAFRAFNRRMCESDPLLPAFSTDMRYALLTKNHLVHALKLYTSGTHLLHGTREPIKPNPAYKLLEQHLSDGIACEVMREELWADEEGVQAIVGEDNMDASTDMAASEVEVLQAIRQLLDGSKRETDPNARFRQVLSKARARIGSSAYTDTDMVNLFNYAFRVPTPLLENLCQVHFAVIPAALLRVRPVDFGMVAKLGKTHPYIKVIIIISLYLGTIASGGGALRRQSGGLAALATGLKEDAMMKLVENREAQDSAEAFLKELLQHYKVDNDAVLTKVLRHCRARLFHRVGKLLLQGWPAIHHAAQTALAKVEDKYAQELADSGAFPARVRPHILYAAPELIMTVGTETTAAERTPKQAADEELVPFNEEDEPSPAEAAKGHGNAEANTAPQAPRKYAYQLPPSSAKRLSPVCFGACPKALWRLLAQQRLSQMFAKQKLCAQSVEVCVVEASEPIVFQARALKDFDLNQLVLVPYTEAELHPIADGDKVKRPKSLHPHLPFLVTCTAGAFDLDDTTHFLIKSPLASCRTLPEQAPAPFWAALEAQASTHPNVRATTFRMTVGGATFALEQEPPAKRGRKSDTAPSLSVAVPVLVNMKAIQHGSVLVYTELLLLEGSESRSPGKGEPNKSTTG